MSRLEATCAGGTATLTYLPMPGSNLALPAKAEEKEATTFSLLLPAEIQSLSKGKPSGESLMPDTAVRNLAILNDADPIQQKTGCRPAGRALSWTDRNVRQELI